MLRIMSSSGLQGFAVQSFVSWCLWASLSSNSLSCLKQLPLISTRGTREFRNSRTLYSDHWNLYNWKSLPQHKVTRKHSKRRTVTLPCMNKTALTHTPRLLNERRHITNSLLVRIEYHITLRVSPLIRQVLDAVSMKMVGYFPHRAVNYVRDVIDHNCVDILHKIAHYLRCQFIPNIQSIGDLVGTNALRELLVHLSNLTIICGSESNHFTRG